MSNKKRRGKRDPSELKYGGVTYRSFFEVDIAKDIARLRRKMKKKFKVGYESDTFTYTLYRNYTPDFKIEREDGSVIYVEAKGVLDREAKAKMLAARDEHPEVTFVFLFQRDNPVHKGSKMRYSDWCRKNSFDYSIGEVKEEWLMSD